MARRRKNDPFVGFIILVGIIIVVIGWLKQNIIDQISPEGWTAIVIGITIILCLKIISGINRRSRERAEAERLRQEADIQAEEAKKERIAYLTWGIKRAVSIATHQQWVSPHRLKTQVHVTDKQAMEFLECASQAGLLEQAVNGRYYLPGAPIILSIEPPDHA